MSGSGSSGTYNNSGAGGGAGGFSSDCDLINTVVPVSSPNIEVTEGLAVGDLLDVEVIDEQGAQSLVVKYHGNVAGALIHEPIRNCIAQGFIYGAQVVENNDGIIRVRISCVGGQS